MPSLVSCPEIPPVSSLMRAPAMPVILVIVKMLASKQFEQVVAEFGDRGRVELPAVPGKVVLHAGGLLARDLPWHVAHDLAHHGDVLRRDLSGGQRLCRFDQLPTAPRAGHVGRVVEHLFHLVCGVSELHPIASLPRAEPEPPCQPCCGRGRASATAEVASVHITNQRKL